jgi:hypothetical protein
MVLSAVGLVELSCALAAEVKRVPDAITDAVTTARKRRPPEEESPVGRSA